jgi:O-antigen ligase
MAAASILSACLAESPLLSLAGSDWRRMGLPATLACLIIAAAASTLNAHQKRVLLAWIAAAGGLAAAYAVAQFLALDPILDSKLYTIGEGEWAIRRPPSTFGHAGYLSVYLCYALFAAWHLAGDGRRWIWGSVATVAGFAVILAGSRGSWLGAGTGLLVLLAHTARRRQVLMTLLVLTLAGAGFASTPWGEPLRSRLRWFVEDPGGGGRLTLWRDSLGVSPWLGSGPDGFERSFPRHESEALARAFPDRHFESPHNIFLDQLTTTGVASVLALAALLGWALMNYRSTAPGLLAALAAGIVAQQFLADTIATRLVCLMMATLSFPETDGVARRSPVRAVCGVLLLATAVWFGGALLRADRALYQARAAAGRGDLEGLIREGRTASRAFPWGGVHPFAVSRLLGNAGMNPQAAESSRAYLLALAQEEAVKAWPSAASPELVAVHLASLYVVQGRWTEAEPMLENAFQSAPSWYRPHYLRAELWQAQGRQQDAAREARRALDLGVRAHPEMAARCLAILRK